MNGIAAPGAASPARVAGFTGLALLAFAGNSILCRGALGAGTVDPDPFTWMRLTSGAAMLAILGRLGPGRRIVGDPRGNVSIHDLTPRGPWPGAIALTLYAAAFSWAYVRIAAGVGALVLFTATQATMIGWAFWKGERPRGTELLGIAIALLGLLGLASPGRTAPDLVGVALMAIAGSAWGVYSLLGKGALEPVASNAAAFGRSALLATLLLGLAPLPRPFPVRAGVLAVLSGALASAVGYSLWYAALPHLSRTRAAALQLTVPVIAALAGIVLLNEPATLRLAASGAVILGGVALSLVGRARA